MSQPISYRERIYRRYNETHIQASRPPTVESLEYDARLFQHLFTSLLPQDHGAAMFEIGCGSGSFLNFLQRSGYSQASGMDQDAQHIQTATRMGVTGASCGDAIAHLQTCQGVYDVIIAIDVVEHWTKTEIFGYLDVIYSALKPGGIFLWRSPNADGPFAGRLRYGDLTHEISFTKSSAWQLMKVAGFSEVLIRPEEPVATGVRSILRLILWQFFKAAAKLYLFAESYAHEDCLLTANLIVQAKKPKTS